MWLIAAPYRKWLFLARRKTYGYYFLVLAYWPVFASHDLSWTCMFISSRNKLRPIVSATAYVGRGYGQQISSDPNAISACCDTVLGGNFQELITFMLR